MEDDYCKFMLTKAVKQAMVHPEKGGRKKLQLMVVYCGKRLATSPTVSNRRLRLRLRWSGQPESASSTAVAAESASSTAAAAEYVSSIVAAAKSSSSIAAAAEYATLTAHAVPSRPQKSTGEAPTHHVQDEH